METKKDITMIRNYPSEVGNGEFKKKVKEFLKAANLNVKFNGDDVIVFAQNQKIDKSLLNKKAVVLTDDRLPLFFTN